MFSGLKRVKLGLIRSFEIVAMLDVSPLCYIISCHCNISDELFRSTLSDFRSMMNCPKIICHIVLYPHIDSSLSLKDINGLSINEAKCFSQVLNSNACYPH